jgi:2-isopropylmalate synthase
MLKHAGTYQIMDPEELGLTTTLPLGKHSGRHAFRRACAEAG